MKPNQKRTEKDGKPKGSRFFREYFEGYEEVLVPGRKGSTLKRVYTAPYYRQDLSRGQKLKLRAAYLLLYLGAVALYGFCATSLDGSNLQWYTAVCQAAALPFLFWIGWTFITYMPAVGNMKVYDYRRSSGSLKRAALGGWVTLLLSAAATLVYIVLHLNEAPWQCLWCVGGFALAAGLIYAIARVEEAVPYVTVPNDVAIEEAEEIDD